MDADPEQPCPGLDAEELHAAGPEIGDADAQAGSASPSSPEQDELAGLRTGLSYAMSRRERQPRASYPRLRMLPTTWIITNVSRHLRVTSGSLS